MLDFKYFMRADRALDDSVPRKLQSLLSINPYFDFPSSVRYMPVPIYLEGGNIMCSWSDCFLTETTLTNNQKEEFEDDPFYSEEQLRSILESVLIQRIHFVKSMEDEPTGHIDMWAKLLADDLLVINEIDLDAIRKAPRKERQRLLEIKAFLDDQADPADPDSLAALAREASPECRIMRIPMPLPGRRFHSYANALIVNDTILVPRYELDPAHHHDARLRPIYENRVQKAFDQARLRVVFVDSDQLIREDGAVHCVTMQVPFFQPTSHNSHPQ
jgi:agmatine/peptidylarginine deiminase